MIARTADLMGAENIGIGTDLCQDQPDSIVEWMRVGRWTKSIDYGEGSADKPGFHPCQIGSKIIATLEISETHYLTWAWHHQKLMASWAIIGIVSLKTTLALWGRV